MQAMAIQVSRAVSAALLLGALAGGGAARAGDACREWQAEHDHWLVEVVGHYLDGAPQSEIDVALFELLQREAYLTSCEMSAEQARADQVGWRMVGRVPEEYAGAVIDSVLDRAGFDTELRSLFDTEFLEAPLDVSQGPPLAPGPARGAR